MSRLHRALGYSSSAVVCAHASLALTRPFLLLRQVSTARNVPLCSEDCRRVYLLRSFLPQCYDTAETRKDSSTLAQQIGFVAHEWKKHGACSGVLDEQDYFEQVCSLAGMATSLMDNAEPIMAIATSLDTAGLPVFCVDDSVKRQQNKNLPLGLRGPWPGGRSDLEVRAPRGIHQSLHARGLGAGSAAARTAPMAAETEARPLRAEQAWAPLLTRLRLYAVSRLPSLCALGILHDAATIASLSCMCSGCQHLGRFKANFKPQ